MLVFSREVFDEIITGTSNTWYSSSEHNALLGSADSLLVLAYATNVTETTGTLRVAVDMTGDNQTWWPAAAFVINSSFGGTTAVMKGQQKNPISFARLKISMTGTNPQCRLKVTVVGRSS